ncbi:NAD(P)-dependent dehydrogenase (short-subunit alcohol dehydrogenase family) [Rhodoligotrophos appendicifer]|uniref:SDR family NAD(P)-dependent oxidoreductase n=1 Tax=Rhodoligotrophos appendicifer TaxID=987056 RepID=UPI001185CA2D|nr:SDR family oxidoreductase [Rhodoligotrophos appendicifer]
MSVEGKGIVVTGGANGLGLAAVEMLTARGARVAIIDVNPKSLDPVVERLTSGGADVFGLIGDIVPKTEAYGLFGKAVDRLGRVDGVINCAGVYPRKPILEITDEDWTLDWTVNVRGTYNIMAAAVELMRGQDIVTTVRGRIVNITSVDAFKAHPKNAHYAATKAAVVSLTRSFADEFAPDQILINSVAPAGIATEKAKGAGFLDELASHTPLRRNAQPDDIAEWIVFMLSDANRYMTGENVIVSGGYIYA